MHKRKSMSKIVFIDTEVDVKSRKVLDFGGVNDKDEHFHSNSGSDFLRFISSTVYVCGHNILNHDLPYLTRYTTFNFSQIGAIDTLFLSPLLFPARPYHALVKDDKLQTEDLNNPLNDAIKAKDLFYDEVSAFNETDADLQQIYFCLLGDKKEFSAFFKFINYTDSGKNITELIQNRFFNKICHNALLDKLISRNPVELAFCLALINTDSHYSITPPWLIKNYPDLERVMYLLRSNPCISGCAYCNQSLCSILLKEPNPMKGLKMVPLPFFIFHRNHCVQKR